MFCFIISTSLQHRLREAEGNRMSNVGRFRYTVLDSSQPLQFPSGFPEGRDKSEKIFTSHTYQRNVWRVLWRPGVCVSCVYEAAAFSYAWKDVKNRQAGGSWESGGGRHLQEEQEGFSSQKLMRSSACVSSPTWTQALPPHHCGGKRSSRRFSLLA